MKSADTLQTVNEKVAAQLLDLSVHTLQNRRYLAQPPKFIKIGRMVRYRIADLEEYLNECTVEPRPEQLRE